MRFDGCTPRKPARAPAIHAVLIALLAGACDPATPASGGAEGPSRDVVVAAAGEGGAALGRHLPAHAPAYPGARVVSRISGLEGAGAGTVVVMEADAPFADVVAFYDRAATRAGTEPAMRIDKDGKAIRMFKEGRATGGGSILVIEHGDADRGTRIVLTSGVPNLGIEVPGLAVAGRLGPPPPGEEGERVAERKAPASDVRLQ